MLFQNHQVCLQWLQHMLERAYGSRVPHQDWLAGHSGAHTVRDNPVLCKIPAPNDIPCPRRGHRNLLFIQKRFLIAVGCQFRAGFAVRIGIVAVQGVCFPVSPNPFPVFVYFIRGDIQDGRHPWGFPDAFQYVYRPHHIGFICIKGVFIAFPDNGLGSHMDYQLRAVFPKHCLQPMVIPHVAFHRNHIFSCMG